MVDHLLRKENKLICLLVSENWLRAHSPWAGMPVSWHGHLHPVSSDQNAYGCMGWWSLAHPPPHTWVPGWSNQHSSHVDGQPASAHNLPVLYIYPLITPKKPVYSEPLSVTVPVPVPPQRHTLFENCQCCRSGCIISQCGDLQWNPIRWLLI